MTELLDPASVLELVAAQIPKRLHGHVLIVGSLAAAYHHRAKLVGGKVNTKDADVLIHPAGAIDECRSIAQELLDSKWKPRSGGTNSCYPTPSADPVESLRVIRLNPPEVSAYFIELLALPHGDQKEPKKLHPCKLKDGWYCIPSFRFMSVLAQDPSQAECGLSYATPSMMALANLLSHPEIGTARISEPLAPDDPPVLRSAKDLGRVLALARLAEPAELEEWHERWEVALREKFPSGADDLAKSAGRGLDRLLADDNAIDDALHAVQVGLLAGLGVNRTELIAIAREVQELVVKPLAGRFR